MLHAPQTGETWATQRTSSPKEHKILRKGFAHFPPNSHHDSRIAPGPFCLLLLRYSPSLGYIRLCKQGPSIFCLNFYFSPKVGASYTHKHTHIHQNHSLNVLNTCDKWSGGRLRQGNYCEENEQQTAAAAKSHQSCPTLCDPRWQPTRLPCPQDSPGKNTGVRCHFLVQQQTKISK